MVQHKNLLFDQTKLDQNKTNTILPDILNKNKQTFSSVKVPLTDSETVMIKTPELRGRSAFNFFISFLYFIYN
jgi:hypothetical protein